MFSQYYQVCIEQFLGNKGKAPNIWSILEYQVVWPQDPKDTELYKLNVVGSKIVMLGLDYNDPDEFPTRDFYPNLDPLTWDIDGCKLKIEGKTTVPKKSSAYKCLIMKN